MSRPTLCSLPPTPRRHPRPPFERSVSGATVTTGLAIAVLIGCSGGDSSPLPEAVGPWEAAPVRGTQYVIDGDGFLPFDNGEIVEFRAPITWPAGVAPRVVDWDFRADRPSPNVTFEFTEQAIIARLDPVVAHDQLPIFARPCDGGRCAESYSDMGVPTYQYFSGPTDHIVLPVGDVVVGVGERRPWQALAIHHVPDLPTPVDIPYQTQERRAVRSNQPVAYATGDPSIATVTDAGFIVGVAPGETALTVTSGAHEVQARIVVTDTPPTAIPPPQTQVLSDGESWRHRQAGGFAIAHNPDDAPTGQIRPDGEPVLLIRSRGDIDGAPHDVLGGEWVLVSWTGTGLGYEWLPGRAFDHSLRTELLIDTDGIEYLTYVDEFLGVRVEVWRRTGPEEPWEMLPLPIRPHLDRGAEMPASRIVAYGNPTALVTRVRMREAERGGIWVAYEAGYLYPPSTYARVEGWEADDGCYHVVRLMHVAPDGETELVEVFRDSLDFCDGFNGGTHWLTESRLLHIAAENEHGMPELYREAPGGGQTSFLMKDWFDGQEWQHEYQFQDQHLEAFITQFGTDFVPYVSFGRAYDVLAAIEEIDTNHDRLGLHPLHPPVVDRRSAAVVYDREVDGVRRLEVAVAPAIDIHHELPDEEGRRVGDDIATPVSWTGPRVTDTCQAVEGWYRESVDAEWSPGGVLTDDEVRTASANSPDGIYYVSVGGDGFGVARSSDCREVFPLAQFDVPLGERGVALVDDGAVWSVTMDDARADRVRVVMMPDPVADGRTHHVVDIDLTTPATYTAGVWSMGLHATDDGVVLLAQLRNHLLQLTLDRSSGEKLDERWFEDVRTSDTWSYGVHQAIALDGGGWLIPRGRDGNTRQLVRTTDFDTIEVVFDDVPPAPFVYDNGLMTRLDQPTFGASPLRLSDGRIVYVGASPDGAPNRDRALWFALSDDEGESWTERTFFRPHGGTIQLPQSVYELPDGRVGVFLWDVGAYVGSITYDTAVWPPEPPGDAVTQLILGLE